MSRFGYRNQREGQRGALLVLFALLLPVFFACAGLAVDLGKRNTVFMYPVMTREWQVLFSRPLDILESPRR